MMPGAMRVHVLSLSYCTHRREGLTWMPLPCSVCLHADPAPPRSQTFTIQALWLDLGCDELLGEGLPLPNGQGERKELSGCLPNT